MYRSRALRLLGIITVLWLAAVAFLGGAVFAGLVLTVPGLCALLLCLRQVLRGTFESVAPWACCALFPLALLAAISLGNVHLHEFTGSAGSACDVVAQPCDPQPWQGFLHSMSLVLSLATGVVMVRLISLPARLESSELSNPQAEQAGTQ